MKTVNVLGRINRFDHARFVYLARQRQLHEDAVNIITRVERLNFRQQLGGRRLFGQFVMLGAQPQCFASAHLVAHIDRRRRIVPDPHGHEARHIIVRLFQACGVARHFALDLFGHARSVQAGRAPFLFIHSQHKRCEDRGILPYFGSTRLCRVAHEKRERLSNSLNYS
jgi:hypothetical protein